MLSCAVRFVWAELKLTPVWQNFVAESESWQEPHTDRLFFSVKHHRACFSFLFCFVCVTQKMEMGMKQIWTKAFSRQQNLGKKATTACVHVSPLPLYPVTADLYRGWSSEMAMSGRWNMSKFSPTGRGMVGVWGCGESKGEALGGNTSSDHQHWFVLSVLERLKWGKINLHVLFQVPGILPF